MEKKLFKVVKRKKVCATRILLSRGDYINIRNKNGNTLLHEAVLRNSVKIVKLLISRGADVKLKNNKDRTALRVAVDHYRNEPMIKRELVKILITAGADEIFTVNEKYNSFTLLQMILIKTMDPHLVKFMINRGADVNAYDRNRKWTALFIVAARILKFKNLVTMYETLLSHGADCNAKNASGQTVIHTLSNNPSTVEPETLEKVYQAFAKHGADFNMVDSQNLTPIDIAIFRENTAVVQALVKHGGVNVNSPIAPNRPNVFKEGDVLLHGACSRIDLPTVKFLLTNGANINQVNDNNETPLMYALHSATIRLRDVSRKDETTVEKILTFITYFLEWDPDVNITSFKKYNTSSFLKAAYNLSDYLWIIIIEHLAKLWAANRSIHKSLLKVIYGNTQMISYFKWCKEELQIAKDTKLHSNTKVTVFNLLMDDEKKLLRYADNVDLFMGFAELRVATKFQIYGELIHKKFLKVLAKRKNCNKTVKSPNNQLNVNLSCSKPNKEDHDISMLIKHIALL